jgi:hypothetical protein
MAKGIFVHRTDAIYDDSSAKPYQFPRQYLGRVSACVGVWIIYHEPRKIRETRGYFAFKVEHVVSDPTSAERRHQRVDVGHRQVQAEVVRRKRSKAVGGVKPLALLDARGVAAVEHVQQHHANSDLGGSACDAAEAVDCPSSEHLAQLGA